MNLSIIRHPTARFLVITSMVLSLSGCLQQQQQPDVLAIWDDGQVSIEDLDRHLLQLPFGRRFPPDGADPTRWLEDRVMDVFVRQVFGSETDPDTTIENPTFARALELGSRAILAQVYLKRHDSRFNISSDDARAYFDEHSASWHRPERRTFMHILIAPKDADAGSYETACDEAEGLRKAIFAGASFEETAQRHSDSANAAAGGLVAPVRRDQLRPEVSEVVFTLEPGRVSEVVRTPAGCSLFQVVQVARAVDPSFEQLRGRIVEQIATQRRAEWLEKLVTDRVADSGSELPEWVESNGPAPTGDDPTTVLFSVGGATITRSDLSTRMRQTGSPAATAMQELLAELVLSRALIDEAPERAAEVSVDSLKEATIRYRSARSFESFLQAQPPEIWRNHYEANRTRFRSEPRIGLTLYSWPIESGDPMDSVARPERFSSELRSTPAGAEELWAEFSGFPGVRRESIPESDLRLLGRQRNALSHVLMSQVAENDVVGPYRFRARLWVAHITSYVPARQLEFDEAVNPVRADYMESKGLTLREEWRSSLADEHDLEIIPEHLANFGDRLLEKLQGGL